ncbi:MAG: hypothetical protein ACXVAX_10900 [Pseudobdellovibrio sp.]
MMKSIILLFSLIFVTQAFAEIYQLQNYNYNIRSSPRFSGGRNKIGILPEGSTFEVLAKSKKPNGAYGLKIKLINPARLAGLKENSEYWVYDRRPGDNPDFKRIDGSEASTPTVCESCQRQSNATPQSSNVNAVADVTREVETAGERSSAVCDQNYQSLWHRRAQAAAWNKSICEAFTQKSTSILNTNISDIEQYCPNYKKLTSTADKMQFWIYFMSALADKETDNFNALTESDQQYFGDANASVGLFQMSIGDGCPGIKNKADLKDTAKNISCAVFKLNTLITQDHVVASGSSNADAKGAARYWGPLREPSAPEVNLTTESLTRNAKMRYECSGQICISKRESIKRLTKKLNVCTVK